MDPVVQPTAVHSRNDRRLSDTATTATAGQEVLIPPRVQRLFCDNAGRAKKTSTEQVPELTLQHAQRTTILQRVLAAATTEGGDRGGRTLVRYPNQFRSAASIPSPPSRPPSGRCVAGWIMTNPPNMNEINQQNLVASPHLTALAGHVRAFATIICARRGQELAAWVGRRRWPTCTAVLRRGSHCTKPDLLRERILLAE